MASGLCTKVRRLHRRKGQQDLSRELASSSSSLKPQTQARMCMKTECPTCHKPTWKGCGQHIESALSGTLPSALQLETLRGVSYLLFDGCRRQGGGPLLQLEDRQALRRPKLEVPTAVTSSQRAPTTGRRLPADRDRNGDGGRWLPLL